ncbi:MAG: sulfotransferase [Verrucomicrobiota bacterium]
METIPSTKDERANHPADDVLLIVGMGRSGTSLVRAVLSQHRDIAMSVRGELHFHENWNQKYGPAPTEKQREQFVAELLASSELQNWEVDWTLFRYEPKRFDEDFYLDAFYQLGDFYRRAKGKKYWGEKSTSTIKHLSQITREMPRAAFLLVVRDPRDVFCSMRRAKWNEGRTMDPGRFGHTWAVEMCRCLGRLNASAQRYALVRHEDMVLSNEKTLRRALETLGFDYYPELLKPKDLKWEKNTSFGAQEWTDPGHEQHTQELKFDPDTLGRWKDHLGKNDIAALENHAKFGMLAFGYTPELATTAYQDTLGAKIKRKLSKILPR